MKTEGSAYRTLFTFYKLYTPRYKKLKGVVHLQNEVLEIHTEQAQGVSKLGICRFVKVWNVLDVTQEDFSLNDGFYLNS